MSSYRIPEQSGDKDGNAGALLALACPQNRSDSGGRKLSPLTVRPILHAGPQAGPERSTPGHGTVCKGGGAEETTACEGRDEEEFGAGIRGLQGAYKECFGISITGEGVEGWRR